MQIDAFEPAEVCQVTISVGTTTGYTSLPADGECLELYNTGTAVVFVETGPPGTVATVAGSYPVGPGQCKIIKKAPGDQGIATISGTAAQNLYVSSGNGI